MLQEQTTNQIKNQKQDKNNKKKKKRISNKLVLWPNKIEYSNPKKSENKKKSCVFLIET